MFGLVFEANVGSFYVSATLVADIGDIGDIGDVGDVGD